MCGHKKRELHGKVQDIKARLPHCTRYSQSKSHLWVIEARPKESGGVKHLGAIRQVNPLLGLGHTGQGARTSGCLAAEGVNKGGLTHIGYTGNHDARTAQSLPTRLVAWQ